MWYGFASLGVAIEEAQKKQVQLHTYDNPKMLSDSEDGYYAETQLIVCRKPPLTRSGGDSRKS